MAGGTGTGWDTPGSLAAQTGPGTGSGWETPAANTRAGRGGPVTGGASHGGIFGSAVHWVGSKADLAARDLKGIPGGVVQAGHFAVSPFAAAYDRATGHGAAATRQVDFAKQFEKGTVKGVEHTVAHPLADPFQTALLAAPAFHVPGSVLARGTAAAEAAGAGEGLAGVGKAVARRPVTANRFLRSGPGAEPVPIYPSDNPTVRAAQGLYDKAVQRAIYKNPEGRLAAHGQRRISGSLAETARYQQRLREVPANLLDDAAKRLSPTRGRVPGTTANRLQRVEQAALELTSVNTSPEEAAAYHLGQAAKGVEPKLNLAVGKLYQAVAAKGLLTRNEAGDVIVAAAHPKLAAADLRLAAVQGKGDEILARYGVRSPEALQARVDAPGVTRRAGLLEQDREAPIFSTKGRGFVSYAVKEPKGNPSAAASSIGPVVGEPRAPITAKEFTGAGIERGQVPKDVTGSAARHFRQILKFQNTSEIRKTALSTGSDLRRTTRDILVKVPGEDHAAVPPEVEALLGKSKLTTDDVAGIQAALDAYRQELIPGLRNHFAEDNAAHIGEAAPAGHRWVDRLVLGDLAKARTVGPPGLPARIANTLNSAVTAATVYFKIGHVGTRILTNAATNIIQGSATPLQIADSLRLWKALSREDKLRAFAASGQHGFSALPHEGVNLAARVAGKGANWWAKHADSPFRFNSIAYEARKAGYDTPAKFRGLLDKLEDPSKLTPEEAAKVDRVAKEANRSNIAYDRLSDTERRFVTRALWFYPWVKGASVFAGRTLLEHPYKSAALGQAGAEGRQHQFDVLGNVPSYEAGLIPLGGGKVTDLSTFSPFATPADVIEAGARPADLSGFLNPVYTSLLHLIQGQDEHGNKTTHPYSAALQTLFSPTPEAQILAAFQGRHGDQSKRLFPQNPALGGTYNAVIRALLGPAARRKVNQPVLTKDYETELKGR